MLVIYEGQKPSGPKKKGRSLCSDEPLSDIEEDEDLLEEVIDDEEEEVTTVKMIDFAHSTFEGFLKDSVVHIGPDAGYIKGLDSLIHLLQRALYPPTSTTTDDDLLP